MSAEGDRVTTLELFFDLAYVFAFIQVSMLMIEHHDATGILQGLAVLGLLWWSWTAYSWLANQARADEGLVRIAMIVATMAVFAVGLAVPEAYHDRDGGLFGPMVFVCAYLVARCTHGAVYFLAAVGDERARREVVLTVLASMLPSGILLTAGALLGSPGQVWCVSAAAATEPAVAYATTRGLQGRINSAAHFAERHGLVVMLALGESITALGFGATIGPISLPILAGAILAVLIAVAMWWAYFARLARTAGLALTRQRGRRRATTARDGYTYLHFPIIAGIVLAAVGVESAMVHIGQEDASGLLGAGTLAGGVAGYLVSTALFAGRVIGGWRWSRLCVPLILLAAVPLLATLSPLAVLSMVAGMMVALLLTESLLTSDGLRLTWPTLQADECPRQRHRTGTGDIDEEPSVGAGDVHRRRQT
ncbi:low temperature requirement protein A [Micromonospora sp. CB01531]|uniref:low temperature requirement protein A n=1 Tax=Micromonospora sp. CB01531 TaxID=1718947 RepID=UPI00093AAC2A|nr:low temperature requirement protein A [Micromonospora sp. CB01531]